ncbi:MAG TPA: hypothetical protein VD794_02705 [Flavisolibacter sp.]|nr:hypothetical protein [Flavisolibacter sp.]
MTLISALIKIWVAPFYRRNTGFFVFFFFLFFGTVNPDSLISYHLSLIQSILSSFVTLTGVLIIWFCYNIKCTGFIYKSLMQEDGQFLYQLQAISTGGQLLLLTFIEVLLFLPVAAYILLVSSIAIQQSLYLQTSILLLFLLAICIGSGLYYSHLLNNTWKESKALLIFKRTANKRAKKLFFMLIHFSAYKKLQILTLKLLSLIILYIVLVWNGDRYDHDSLVLFLVVILLSHALLAFQYVQFMEKSLLFIRNLPISSLNIFLCYYIAFALLFLPELAYILVTGHQLIPFYQILAIYFTLLHTLLFYSMVQYSGAIDKNEFVKIIFGASFVSIFFFNSEAYIWWAILTLVFSTLIFFSSYGQYEPPIES